MITEILQAKFPTLKSSALIKEIADVGQYFEFEKGSIILDTNQIVKTVPLVISGSIKILRPEESGKEILLYYVYPGETCSLSLTCCMASQHSKIRAIVEDDAELISIPVQYMDSWMDKYFDWKQFVLNAYQKRFNTMLNIIEDLAFKKMDKRVWDYLSENAWATSTNTVQKTHAEIAREIGTSREVISRILKQLEKTGYLSLSRNAITLTKKEWQEVD